jgi:hypothetical protein
MCAYRDLSIDQHKRLLSTKMLLAALSIGIGLYASIHAGQLFFMLAPTPFADWSGSHVSLLYLAGSPHYNWREPKCATLHAAMLTAERRS